jgi:hypothetical protein
VTTTFSYVLKALALLSTLLLEQKLYSQCLLYLSDGSGNAHRAAKVAAAPPTPGTPQPLSVTKFHVRLPMLTTLRLPP